MNEIVKYHNDMNKISFTGFNEKELNLFFSLVFLAKEKGVTEFTVPFSQLKILSEETDRNKDRFIKALNNVNKKLIALHHQIKVDDTTYTFSLFNVFGVNEKDNVLTVEVNKIFSYILNDLIGNFTKFELENFVSLKSTYSKNLFKVLKQWDNKKEKEFSLEEFKALLGITGKYEKMSALDTFVLGQLRKELPEFFPNFKIKKIKTGKTITSIKFTWGEKQQNIDYVEDIEIEVSEELQKAFEKAGHNRFIKPFLTDDNKAELIEYFEDEKILIKGLLYAYKKIDKDFKRLSYLIKTITTGAAEEKKVIKTKKKTNEEVTLKDIENDNVIQTSFSDIKAEEKKVELKEISEEEFEKLYNQYLIDNNAENSPYIKKAFSMPYKIIEKPKKAKKKVYTIEDIPEEKLLGKNGKKLVGGALQMRIRKILEEMNK